MKYFIIALLFLTFTGCAVVGPGERGVRITLGSVSDTPKEPGPYLWIPFIMGMAKVDVQLQKSEEESSAASKDMQEVTAHVAVNWSVQPDQVVKVYQRIGDESEVLSRVIIPAVNEVMKTAMAQMTAEEALTKRAQLKDTIDTGLRSRLTAYGITMTDVSIVNFKYSDSFEKAIEEKQVAEQKAQQASYEAQQATQEAKAQVNRAEGQAKAQGMLQQSLTAAILQQRAIDKWDGKLPVYMNGSAPLPFLNVK